MCYHGDTWGKLHTANTRAKRVEHISAQISTPWVCAFILPERARLVNPRVFTYTKAKKGGEGSENDFQRRRSMHRPPKNGSAVD